MAFRSHLGRGLDMSLPSNRAIVALTLLTGAAATAVVWSGGASTVLLAPLHTFALWALLREIDPDHDTAALVAGALGGLWVVAGLDASGLAVTAGVAVAARVALSSTGRRPLPSDLLGLVLIVAAVSLWDPGWVAGFSIAIAIYVDNRMSGSWKQVNVMVAIIAGIVAAAIGSLMSDFPQQTLTLRPEIVVPTGLLALIAIAREPQEPTSVVDSRRGGALSAQRLHITRGIAAVAIFGAALLAGSDAASIGPAAFALAIALVSNEGERIRRMRT